MKMATLLFLDDHNFVSFIQLTFTFYGIDAASN